MGVSLAVATGALLAVALAISLSPLSPLGPVRFVYPYRGVSFDWTVLGFGVAALVVTLEVIAVVLARRELRRIRLGHRVGSREENSWVTRVTATAGRAALARHRTAIRVEVRSRGERRARAIGHPRRGPRGRRPRHDGDVRGQPQQSRLASLALRVELELRVAVGLRRPGGPARAPGRRRSSITITTWRRGRVPTSSRASWTVKRCR